MEVFNKWFKNNSVNPAVSHLMRMAPFEEVSDPTVVSDSIATIWGSVSISRSQFDELYIGTIRNVAFYMQDKHVFTQTLFQAATEIQTTLITKLPYKRPREEAAKFEQLWKYTLVCCHLLKGAAELNRRFYNGQGARILYPAYQSDDVYFDAGPCERAVLLSQSLQVILPKSAASWLLNDEERCLREIHNAIFSAPCFIDPIVVAPLPNTATEKKADTRPKQLPEVVAEVKNSTAGLEKTGSVESNENLNLATISSFQTWISSQKLSKRDGLSYFESRETVEAFLKSQQSDCTVGQFQDKLLDSGFSLETIRGRKNKKVMVMFLPEKSNE